MPLDGPGCLFLPPSDAPSPSAAGLRASFPHLFPHPISVEGGRGARATGHQIGTAMLSYTEHGKLQASAQV